MKSLKIRKLEDIKTTYPTRRLRFVPLLAVLVLLPSVIAPIGAAPPTIPPLLQHLSGERITLFDDYLKLSSSQTTHVWHGWVTGGKDSEPSPFPFWSEMTPEQKVEFLHTANFELHIIGPNPKGAPYVVELRRTQWYQQSKDRMWVAFYVEFPADTFEPGIYLFEGFWTLSINGKLFDHDDSVIVEFGK